MPHARPDPRNTVIVQAAAHLQSHGPASIAAVAGAIGAKWQTVRAAFSRRPDLFARTDRREPPVPGVSRCPGWLWGVRPGATPHLSLRQSRASVWSEASLVKILTLAQAGGTAWEVEHPFDNSPDHLYYGTVPPRVGWCLSRKDEEAMGGTWEDAVAAVRYFAAAANAVPGLVAALRAARRAARQPPAADDPSEYII